MNSTNSGQARLWLILFISLILVCLPRFNRNQFLFKRPPADLPRHTAYIDFFRDGQVPEILLSRDSIAVNWRPLMPFLAAQLPFKTITSLSITSIICLMMGLVFLYKSQQKMGIRNRYSWLGCFLFVFSFPTFYYTTIGSVDAGLILFLSLGVYLLYSDKWWPLLLVIMIGTLAKEGIILLVPAAFTYLIVSKQIQKKWHYPLLYLAGYLTVSVWIRQTAPNAHLEDYPWLWESSWEMFHYNLDRVNSWLSVPLTLGIPGLLAIIYSRKKASPIKYNRLITIPLLVGVLSALATYLFAFFSTVADGRTVWASYPFLVPLAMYLLERHRHSSA